MLKIGICDDEPIMMETIKNSVSEKLEDFKIKNEIQSFSTGEALLTLQNIKDFDILFLDIELKTTNGVEIAKMLRENGYENLLVFITSFADYSIMGYKVNAFRFILKDKLEIELEECIRNIIVKLGLKKACYEDFMIDIKDILYIESMNRQVIFHFKNGDEYRVYDTLDNAEQRLNSESLIRVRKSHLVNILYVKSIKNYTITLSKEDKTDFEIIIPKDKYGEIKKKISIKKSLWR